MTIESTDLQRLNLQPGDRLVIRVPGRLTAQQAAMLQAHVSRWAGDAFPVLILDDDMSLEVVTPPGEDQEIVR